MRRPEEEEEYVEEDEEQYDDEEYEDGEYVEEDYEGQNYEDEEYVEEGQEEYVEEDEENEEYANDDSNYDSEPADNEYDEDDYDNDNDEYVEDEGYEEDEPEDREYEENQTDRPTIGQRISGFFSKLRVKDAPEPDDDYEAFEGEHGSEVQEGEEEVFEEAYDEGDFYEDDYVYEDEAEPNEDEPEVSRGRREVTAQAPQRRTYQDAREAVSYRSTSDRGREETPQSVRENSPQNGGFANLELDFDDEDRRDERPVERQAPQEPAQSEKAKPLSDPNLLHFDRVEDEDVAPRDTSGLDKLTDSYDLYSAQSVQNAQRTRPEPMGDPSWGVSTYQPARPSMNIARRAALFDIPDPSSVTVDPFANDYDDYDDDYEGGLEYEDRSDRGDSDYRQNDVMEERQDEVVSERAVERTAPEVSLPDDSVESQNDRNDQVQEQDSQSQGVQGQDSQDAQDRQGHEPAQKSFWGSDSSRKSDWKGGATVRQDLLEDGDEPLVIDEQDLQDAIVELGDEYLVSHDIWFVATGASEVDHAGIRAFIDEHRRDIRGAFLINMDSVGAGALSVLVREGLHAPRRADRRLVRTINDIAQDLHIRLESAICNWGERDSATAMRSRVRAVSIIGLDDNNLPAYSHTPDDVPENVDPRQVSNVVRMVTELIRRS